MTDGLFKTFSTKRKTRPKKLVAKTEKISETLESEHF
jgi:hypothetical protein